MGCEAKRIDAIIISQNVFTGTNDEAKPAAIALSGDRIVAVGNACDLRDLAANANTGQTPARVFDFEDAFVTPGFHDSHLHFFHSALYSSPLAEMFLGENEADCVRRMQELSLRRPTGWLLSQGWREYRWNPPVMPSKHSLDAAFPDRPVALYSGDAHTLWLNSVALRELGVNNDSVAPAGGSYDRDDTGELTGIVREAAAMELMPKIVGAFTDAEIDDAYRGFLARLAREGITGVCDMSLMASPGLDFIRDDSFARLLEKDELTARIHMFPTLLADQSRFERMLRDYTHPLLSTRGFKQFFDGVSSQHTAWVTDPYTNARFADDCGRPTIDPALMRDYVLAAAEKGYPVRIHTIGDAAIHAALNFFEEARERFGELPQGRRNCLEHVENFLPDDIARLASLNVVAAVQPPHITLDPGGPERDLGNERVPYMWPLRALLDVGGTLAFGTDSPVVDVKSMDMLYVAVTRQDPATHEPAGGWLPSERVTMAEAIRAYTLGSATAASRAHELGTIAPGMLADITVVDRNLLISDAADIQKTRTLATFTGGRCIYTA
ncbi:amidohydrolase [Adlercreutzia sp. ZJ141]|uniref:amidohydrolase n=1 Tax=Adlercreutzia sp. ZJ141 TaxID=2709406 RepID=UPI0013EB6E37|nr:amidohydrolase [Adlercreutzia sp. ZJ141]